MKRFGQTTLLCNIAFYNAMLNAYAEGMERFEYNGVEWITDDAFIDFAKDLKRGNLKVKVEKN